MKVTNNFVEIYKNFNVFDQVEKMNNLSDEELYLLLTLCIDKHSEEDPVVINNFKPYEEICMNIFDLQDDKEVDDLVIKKLVEITGDKYIDTDVITDNSGDKLPEPYSKEEVRDIKIKMINN